MVTSKESFESKLLAHDIILLARLLGKKPERSVSLSFATVEGFIKDDAKVELPPPLIDQLNLESLSWVICRERPMVKTSLPVLYMGKRPQESNKLTTDIADATVTIMIDNTYLRAAWVDRNQKKIIAAVYKLMGDKTLAELNVSMRYFEWKKYAEGLSKDDIDSSTVSIPTDIEKPYETAGLITKIMYDLTNESVFQLPNIETPRSSRALIFKFTNNPTLKARGYHEERKGKIATVGLTDNEGSPSWRIDIPGKLQ